MNNYLKIAIIFSTLSGAFLFLAVLILTSPAIHPALNLSNTGQIGDTIGGVTAPFVGVAVALLTFLAFYMQYQANKTHNLQFDKQSIEKEREKHENKILYLIKQNRSIANDMAIGDDIEGPKCFSRMFNEFSTAYEIVNSFYSKEISNGEIENEEIINISFLIFYNGVGETSNTLNNAILNKTPRSQELLAAIDSVVEHIDMNTIMIMTVKKTHGIRFNETKLKSLEYVPFDGHTTRLGQYFRNLFHILNYTENIDVDLINKIEKYELIKSLRSQLSSYEQILIYFNSISVYGSPLKDSGFLNVYGLIKNIPLPLIAFSGEIHNDYNDIEFEWNEIINRANQ